jgi:cytochrome P450
MPEPVSTNPFRRLLDDWRAERQAPVPYPPGDTTLSLRRTHLISTEPLGLLLDAYQRHGPVFTLRLMHQRHVFALGPEANQCILVRDAAKFGWREGIMGDLIPLVGDGMLTTDGDFHRRARRIVMPVFGRERTASAHAVMCEETERALARWGTSEPLEVYTSARELALRIAMRTLLGIDPDRRPAGLDVAAEFERAQAFHGRELWLKLLRGPGTPFAEMVVASRRLDGFVYAEIARRRRSGHGDDVLSLLLEAEDEDGYRLPDRQIRDEVMTLLLASHLSTAATTAFLLYELARHPQWTARIIAELTALGHDPSAAELQDGALEQLDLALAETLRLYPAAWLGPRRCLETVTIAGVTVPRGAHVHYCSLASHRLPDVWENPDEFQPERFAPKRRDRIPRRAYIPFGGGSRICLGMRFAQLEVKTIAARVLRDFSFSLAPGFRLRLRVTPSLAPANGVPLLVSRRHPAAER